VAAPGTPIMANFAAATVNGVALPALTNVLQGYVPSYIIYNGQQISQLAQNSQGNAQRMAAIFGKVSFKINDQLDFEAGLRYSWDSNFQYSDNSRLGTFSVSYQRDLSGGSVAANPNYGKLNGYMQRNCTAGADPRFAKTPLGSGGDCLDTRASIGKPDHEPSYKVGLNWKPQDGQFGYLFYAHGYKAAGLNSQQNAPSLRSFDVEKVDDFEAGWKSKWLNNRVNTSVGVYYTMDKGFQFNLFDPVTTNTAVGNLGGTTALYGLELTANAKLSGWVIDANLAITKSKLGTAIQAPTYLLGALVNGTVTAGVAGGTAGPINLAGGNSNQCSAANTAKYCVDYSPYLINVSGETNPLAPQMTATLQVGYEFLMGNGTLRPRVNYSYSGVAYGSLFQNVDTFAMRARGLVNVNLDYENGPWSTSAYVTNLTNVWYETDSSGNASSPYATTWWGPPRQVGVRFTRKF
jgi:outer membrane receptor protein involved in Fe transport